MPTWQCSMEQQSSPLVHGTAGRDNSTASNRCTESPAGWSSSAGDVVVKQIAVSATSASEVKLTSLTNWKDSGFFLTLCGSSAVSDGAAMGGHAKEIEMVARPRGQDFWVSRSLLMTVGLFPQPDPRSVFAPIVDGEAEVGMAGPAGASKICRFRASP